MKLFPQHYVITPSVVPSLKNYVQYLTKILEEGFQLIQFRSKPVNRDAYLSLLETTLQITQSYAAKVLVNMDLDNDLLTRFPEIAGVHLNSSILRELKDTFLMKKMINRIAKNYWLAASCHNAEELKQAEMINVNFVTLSPVLPTLSHPEAPAMGWKLFKNLCQTIHLPVYALGGMNKTDLQQAKAHGGYGIAGIRTYWEI